MEQSFSQLERRYWSRRAVSSLSEMRRNKEGGLFPKSDGWRNVVEHELVEAEAADVLAEKLGLPEKERTLLRTAVLLHDVCKKLEIEKAKKEGIYGFDASAKEQSDWIRSWGYPEEVVRLTESVGHTSFQEFSRDFDAVSTVRKIIHYVDDITLNDDLVCLDQRVDALELNLRYKELNEKGREIFGGRTYCEVQREIGKRIEQEFAPKLGISDPASIPAFIKEMINVRIRQSGEPD